MPRRRRRKRTLDESTAENIETNSNTNSTSTDTTNKRRRPNQDPTENRHSEPQSVQEESNSASNEEEKQSPTSIFKGKDPFSFTAKELKELCRTKGLKVGGNKSDLIGRLLNPTSTVNRKGSKRTTAKQVHTMLRDAGIEDPEKVNKCLKKGIQKGYFVIDGPDSLDEVILEGKCWNCKRDLEVTIRDALYQPTQNIDYSDRDNEGAVHCGGDDEMCYRMCITQLCEGTPRMDSGKFHNHCEECPGFGKCIGDYREAHCGSCGKHWFAGSGMQFPCHHCGKYGPDEFGMREMMMGDMDMGMGMGIW